MAFGTGWRLPGAVYMTPSDFVIYDLGKSNSYAHKHKQMHTHMHTHMHASTHV